MQYTVSQIANMALTIEDRYLAELDDARTTGGAVIITALRNVGATCNGLVQAQAKAAQTIADPRYDLNYKMTQARTLVGDALAAAQDAVKAYSAALDDAQSRIQASLVPKPPANTDGSLLALRAQEVIKLLEATDPASRIQTAGQMLATALANGDQAKAYILAGGQLLSDTFARLGIKADTVQAQFAKVVGQAQGSSTPPAGAQLLVALSGTGGTVMSLRGFRDIANIVMYGEAQSFNKSLDAYVAIGVIQNGPKNTQTSA